MCKQNSYSKYQKSVIKFLTDHLGIDTPFTYEKTQTNHLKVLIDGVKKPLYTGCTPSDHKSLTNFRADVKRELKASKITQAIRDEPVTEPPCRDYLSASHEKLIKNCIKSIRSRLSAIKSKEQEKVLESRSLDVIASYRENVVKRAIEQALQIRRSNDYIKTKEKKAFTEKVAHYLNFMMPTMACYAELLGNTANVKQRNSEQHNPPLSHSEIKLNNANNTTPATQEPAQAAKPAPEQAAPKQADSTTKTSPHTANVPAQKNQSSAAELMTMSANNRVDLLRNLTKAQSLQLIDDINQAMALNREQDIEAVVSLIKEKGVSLESIIARLEA